MRGHSQTARAPRAAGAIASARSGGWLQAMRLAAVTLVCILSPSLYDRTMLRIAARQVYFAAWQALPGFLLASAALGYVLARIAIGTAGDFGLSQYAVELAVRVVVIELLPLLAALFVALRSGTAIGARVALMRAGGEFDTLRRSGLDPLRHALVPRAIGCVFAVAVLTAFACALGLVLAYLATYGPSPWGLSQYLRVTGQVLAPLSLLGLVLKVLLFGLAVAAIPIGAALAIRAERAQVPVALMRGMVRLALALVAIEVGFLVVSYA